MKLAEIVEILQLDVRTGGQGLDVEVTRGYASDLLSDVMANAQEGDLWVTLQIHQNIVAVAVMKSLSGIILVNGREPEEGTVRKAAAEGIPIMVCKLPAFELVGRLFQQGISGT
jgi:predicted transcriptional regulator